MKDRRKQTLLPLIKNNINTISHINKYSDLTTRVLSDCYASYKDSNFLGMGYI